MTRQSAPWAGAAASAHPPARTAAALVLLALAAVDASLRALAGAQFGRGLLPLSCVLCALALCTGAPLAARLTAWCATALACGLVVVALALPLLLPLDLWLTMLRLDTAHILPALARLPAWWLAALGVLACLRRDAARAAPRSAVTLGVLVPLLFSLMVYRLLHGAQAAEALARAEFAGGPGFRYAVTRLKATADGAQALVTAWSADHIKILPIAWSAHGGAQPQVPALTVGAPTSTPGAALPDFDRR